MFLIVNFASSVFSSLKLSESIERFEGGKFSKSKNIQTLFSSESKLIDFVFENDLLESCFVKWLTLLSETFSKSSSSSSLVSMSLFFKSKPDSSWKPISMQYFLILLVHSSDYANNNTTHSHNYYAHQPQRWQFSGWLKTKKLTNDFRVWYPLNCACIIIAAFSASRSRKQ